MDKWRDFEMKKILFPILQQLISNVLHFNEKKSKKVISHNPKIGRKVWQS